MRWLLAIFLLLPAVEASAQVTCSRTGARCLETANITVAGVRMEDVCTRIEVEELCERAEPLNECEPFLAARVTHDNPLADGECRRTSRECTRYQNGECDRWLLNFTCWNGPLEHPPADLLDRVFHNFEEATVNDCQPLDADPNCQRTTTETIEDYETRVINGMEVTRAWWLRERSYDCTDPSLADTCDPFRDNPVCTQTAEETCLQTGADGSCDFAQLSFQCTANASFEASCAAVNVCVGDNCVGAEQDPSSDYANAAAWLNVLDSMADDFGCNRDGDVVDPLTGEINLEACPIDPDLMAEFEPEIFTGRLMSCNRGTTNCCDFDGEGNCSPESDELAEHRQALVTHYLGSECTSEVLGTCLSVREDYCVYNSRFARVFQEQAHLQTGTQFGTYYSTDPCPALDVYQIEILDVDAMDFSEVFAEMLERTNTLDEGEIADRLTGGVTAFTPEVENVFD